MNDVMRWRIDSSSGFELVPFGGCNILHKMLLDFIAFTKGVSSRIFIQNELLESINLG
jgi:hypothetical protein